MIGWLRKRRQGLRQLRPSERVYVIGDLHGCADLLRRAITLIERDPARVVLLGDYVDRGESAAEVLRLVRALPDRFPDPVVALKGNHEAMMLAFLADPRGQGARWIRAGGAQTLASFGIARVSPSDPPEKLESTAEDLRAALPEGTISWLESRPTWWRSGNLICSHAGLDPGLPPEAQLDEVILWGHADFLRLPRQDGCWVAHGHYMVDVAKAENGRVALDTGAYATGRLTVGLFGPDEMRLQEITVADPDDSISHKT